MPARIGALLLLALALSLATEGFATATNLLNVLRQASLLFLVASGLTLVIIGGGLDLSVAANLTLSACTAALAFKATGSVAAAVATALGCGLAVGLLNGLLVAVVRVPAFLATYGTLWIASGAAYWLMAGRVVYGFPPALRGLGTGFVLGVPTPVWIMLAVAVAGGAFLFLSAAGREVFFTGANEEAARLSGIPVRRRRILVYGLSGLMCGVAALVYLGRVNAAEAGLGDPLLLPAVAAVLIGGTSLFGGAGGLAGTLVGALILTTVTNGLNLLDVGAAWHPFVTGTIILAALGADALLARRGA
nr:ABC transporter permease [Roseomonas acroporae]